MRPGVRVVRGPDWNYGNQDGGEGCLGTVVALYPSNNVLVRWDIGTETECRAGNDSAFDLRVFDNAPIGVDHQKVTCKVCAKYILGLRWKCLECRDYDECTYCYMNAHHDKHHAYVRYNTCKSTVVRVPPAKQSRVVPVSGIVPGANVTKIVNPENDQKKGIVKDIVDLPPEGYHGAVYVEWENVPVRKDEDGNPMYPIYRVGGDGKVELQAIKPALMGQVYIEHLPVLDLTTPDFYELQLGDKVRVDLHISVYKPLMIESPVGWDDRLEKILAEEGTVTGLGLLNRLTIDFDEYSVKGVWWNILTKVNTFAAGDLVLIIDDIEKMRHLQVKHGGWQDSYISILGVQGKVVRLEGQNDALVEVGGTTYMLNQACLKLWRRRADIVREELKDSLVEKDKTKALMLPSEAYRPELSPDITVGVGLRVVRGPDWSPDFEDQDGGVGHVGSIVAICDQTDQYPAKCVLVRWDSGLTNVYRAGYEKKYDLRIHDNAGLGIKHCVPCVECKEEKIFGMLWRCRDCPGGEVTLCSLCYHGDKHDINHQFTRYESVGDGGCSVPIRAISKKVQVSGIFERCVVKRGIDWRWDNQDGGEGKEGEVISIINFSPDTDRDAVEVTWANGYTNVYRLGYRGHVDVIAVKPASAGFYYQDHIPILKVEEDNVLKEGDCLPENGTSKVPEDPMVNGGAGQMSQFREGDKVRIEMPVETLKMIAGQKGAWDEKMTECVGQTGTVLLSNMDDVTVDFGHAGRWTLDELALVKVIEFKPGESVVVNSSKHCVQMLQEERGGWNDLMVEVLGKKGVVEEVDEDGDIKVGFSETSWTFNPECLAHWSEAGTPQTPCDTDKEEKKQTVKDELKPDIDETKMDELFACIMSDNRGRVAELIRDAPQLMLMEVEGKTGIHLASHLGKQELIELFISQSSREVQLEVTDKDLNTPLLAAVKGCQYDVIKYLVGEGANKSVQDSTKQSAVHVAVTKGDLKLLTLLRDLEFDINLKDGSDESPVFNIVSSDCNSELVDLVLNWPGLQVNCFNRMGFSPFLLACRVGNTRLIEKLLALSPELLNSQKPDGCSGLHLAVYNNKEQTVDLLLAQPSIDLNVQDKKGQTPLCIAITTECFTLIEKLLLKGASIQLLDKAETKGKGEYGIKIMQFLEHTEQRKKQGESPRLSEGTISALKKMVDTLQLKKENSKNAIGDSPSSASGTLQTDHSPDHPPELTIDTSLDRISQLIISPAHSSQQGTRDHPGTEDPIGAGEQKDVPEVCESCEDEPVRFKVLPCGHLLCGECIPRKKQKKQLCACCAKDIVEMADIQY